MSFPRRDFLPPPSPSSPVSFSREFFESLEAFARDSNDITIMMEYLMFRANLQFASSFSGLIYTSSERIYTSSERKTFIRSYVPVNYTLLKQEITTNLCYLATISNVHLMDNGILCLLLAVADELYEVAHSAPVLQIVKSPRKSCRDH